MINTGYADYSCGGRIGVVFRVLMDPTVPHQIIALAVGSSDRGWKLDLGEWIMRYAVPSISRNGDNDPRLVRITNGAPARLRRHLIGFLSEVVGASVQIHMAAKVDFDAERGQHGSFDPAGSVGLFFVWSVNHLYVICFMTGHHLVTANPFKDCVHDRPLRRGFTPATLGLLMSYFPPVEVE